MVENEIGFLSWASFRRMAPSILQLEISRLGELIEAAAPGSDVHTALVAARFRLRRFVDTLERADREAIRRTGAPHLEAALVSLATIDADVDEPTAARIRYVVDRLNYVHDRIDYIY